MRFLAISGSLRRVSSNTALLEAARVIAPAGVEIVLHDGIGALPHFNPDINDDETPWSVAAFRAALAASDGVIFSTPEYAHGLPGVLKNALDWLVGSGELVEKPVALFNASPRSTYAVASLTEILTVMSARVIEGASVTVQLAGRALPEGGIAADEEFAGMLREAIAALVEATG
jgi:NAD(P)H-dependent FMN reductase